MTTIRENSMILGIIRTNGKIATVFPDTDQNSVYKRRKKR